MTDHKDIKVRDLVRQDREARREAAIQDNAPGSIGFPHIEAFVDADLTTEFVADRLDELMACLEEDKSLKNRQASQKIEVMYSEVRDLLDEFLKVKQDLSESPASSENK